jgi:hypothetical protein
MYETKTSVEAYHGNNVISLIFGGGIVIVGGVGSIVGGGVISSSVGSIGGGIVISSSVASIVIGGVVVIVVRKVGLIFLK